jgi:hypothetical protein
MVFEFHSTTKCGAKHELRGIENSLKTINHFYGGIRTSFLERHSEFTENRSLPLSMHIEK